MKRLPALIGVAVVVVLVVGAVLARWLSAEGAERTAVLRALPERDVEVLRLDSATAYATSDARGATRIAYREGGRTLVRCADVRRTGSVLSGLRVRVLDVSEPIGLEASC